MTILIADDEKSIREGICQTVDWSSLGIHRVLQAADGREAHRLIRQEAPELAILDIRMPEMTGLEVMAAFRNEPKIPRFILLSGYNDFEYVREALRNRAVDYLLKPSGVTEITNVVSQVVSQLEEEEDVQKAFLSRLEEMEDGKRLAFIRSYLSAGKLPIACSGEEERPGLCSFPDHCSPPVEKAIQYMKEHLSDPDISMGKVAREVLFLHPDYFGKLFKKETGERFSNVLMAMRLDEAMRILDECGSRIKIHEAASRVGLGTNVTYFSQAFKKMCGKLPSQYVRETEQAGE